MWLSDLLGSIQAHAGLVAFTLVASVLFGYLLYRLVYPEGG
jgi:hypothetical protein